MSLPLTALNWRWCRVSGSAVVHLVPPTILRGSRTACGRLSVYDVTIELPAPLIGDVRRCQACYAKAGRS